MSETWYDIECPDCYGEGWENEDEMISCERCDGTGYIVEIRESEE